MASKRNVSSPFLIGLFVLIGSVVIIGSLIWLGANQFLKEQVFYVTYFDTSVEGLEKGSAVKYQGVPCGSVKTIKVAPNGKLVEVVMQLDPNINITDSLRIQPALAGIAGGKFLQLHYPSNPELAKAHPITNFDSPYPLIKSAPSGLEEIEIAMREVMNNFMQINTGEISESVTDFFRESTYFLSNKAIYKTIDNLNQSTALLASILQKADTVPVLDNITNVTAQLVESAKEINNFTQKLNSKIDAIKISDHLEHTFAALDSTIFASEAVVNGLGSKSDLMIQEFHYTLNEIRQTNKYLQKAIRAISENPSAVFLSEPPAKEK